MCIRDRHGGGRHRTFERLRRSASEGRRRAAGEPRTRFFSATPRSTCAHRGAACAREKFAPLTIDSEIVLSDPPQSAHAASPQKVKKPPVAPECAPQSLKHARTAAHHAHARSDRAPCTQPRLRPPTIPQRFDECRMSEHRLPTSMIVASPSRSRALPSAPAPHDNIVNSISDELKPAFGPAHDMLHCTSTAAAHPN